jgi:hypothetical protein
MKLKILDYLVLFVLIAIAYVFTATQKFYIPELLRPFSMAFVVLIILFFFFVWVKPDKIFNLSLLLSIVLGILVCLIIIIELLFFNFSFSYKQPLIWGITIVAPYITGFFYSLVKKFINKKEK